MYRMFSYLLCPLWLCAALVLPASAQDRATVFAAASLSGVLEQIIPASDAVFSYGGSGAMARQVAAGAPADLVIFAHTDWMDWLSDQGVTAANTARAIASNRLVVVGTQDAQPLKNADEFAQRLGARRFAMGQHQAVPAGQYAQAWLSSAGLWSSLSPQAIETQNVRAALALVQRGQVAFGVVYASDAARSPDVAVVHHVPEDTHGPVAYPAAALTETGQRLLDQLRTAKAQNMHGCWRARRSGASPCLMPLCIYRWCYHLLSPGIFCSACLAAPERSGARSTALACRWRFTGPALCSPL